MARLSVRGHKAFPFLAYCHLLDADCTYGKQILTTQPWTIHHNDQTNAKKGRKWREFHNPLKNRLHMLDNSAATAATCKTVAMHSIWYKLCFTCCLRYNYITLNFVLWGLWVQIVSPYMTYLSTGNNLSTDQNKLFSFSTWIQVHG